jgi:hypothetical protein
MARHVVTYIWEERRYIEAETAKQARDIADSLATGLDDLDLTETRVRKATKLERATQLWPDED